MRSNMVLSVKSSGNFRRQRSSASSNNLQKGSTAVNIQCDQATLKRQWEMQQGMKHTPKATETKCPDGSVKTNQVTTREGVDENRDPIQPIAMAGRQRSVAHRIGGVVLGVKKAVRSDIFPLPPIEEEADMNDIFQPIDMMGPFAEVTGTQDPSTEKRTKKSGVLKWMKLGKNNKKDGKSSPPADKPTECNLHDIQRVEVKDDCAVVAKDHCDKSSMAKEEVSDSSAPESTMDKANGFLLRAIDIMQVPPIHEKFGCGTCSNSCSAEFLVNDEEGTSAAKSGDDDIVANC